MNIYRAKTLQTGSMILEALIAILIFSIGILALIGMQATAINSVADSKYRSAAGFLANQMIGTIWANGPPSSSVLAASNVVGTNTASPFFTSFACNPCNAANPNLYISQWYTDGIANLPQGAASIVITPIVRNNASMNQVTVTIHWQPPKDAAAHTHAVSTFIN